MAKKTPNRKPAPQARVRTPATSADLKNVDLSDASGEPADLNSRIIRLLQIDGRMPYSTIAAEIGVSEGTVRNRVRQLIDENSITIQAEALPEAFGYRFNAITFIKVIPGIDINAMATELAKISEVYYLIMMMGEHDLSLATYHKSHEDYSEFLIKNCYSNPHIAKIETSMVLKVHKMKLQWNLHPPGN